MNWYSLYKFATQTKESDAKYDEIRKEDYADYGEDANSAFESAQYFSIGQDNDEEMENNYCWAWINGRIETQKGRTHGAAFGHNITDRTFKGWYDTNDDMLSFVFPLSNQNGVRKTEMDIPGVVMRSLRAKFGNTFRVVVF